MAKIRHNNIIDSVVDVLSVAKDNGILHLYAEDETMDGRHLILNGKKVLHFGTCGYLGLEQHPDIKRGAIEAIEKYGVQFPLSKIYVANPLYKELEALVDKMYNAPCVLSKNCTLSHLAVIPSIIESTDLIILDHQVHASVQEAARKMLSQGVSVEMIRHGNLEMLEAIIIKNRNKYERIWYMTDGVYSMFGDFAPLKQLIELAEKYEQLYLYVDDAHGMSWAGKNGGGYVMSQIGELYRKMILTTTMGKGFGVCGGIAVFPKKEWARKVGMFGGPLTFSVQMEPPILGAAVASARFHLSDEIYKYQKELQEKIEYCNELIKEADLPLIAKNSGPLFFIGAGTMEMANDLIRRLLNNGVYVNLASFPAVPAKNVGVRITVSRMNTMDDIKTMVDKLKSGFEESLIEVGQTREKINKAFKLKTLEIIEKPKENELLKLETYSSIVEIDKELWNKLLGYRGTFDWEGLSVLEKSYTDNSEVENNWKFKYFFIRDNDDEIILMTFIVVGLHKEDIFSKASISKAMEEERVNNPYYCTSKVLMMGSLMTEGNHLYIDRERPVWKQALRILFDELYKVQETEEASNIILRDFDAGDQEMQNFMLEQSFVKVDMPITCVTKDLSWSSEEEFMNSLSRNSRKSFKKEIKKKETLFKVVIEEKLNNDDLLYGIELFKNVKNRNLGLNTFLFPYKGFLEINESDAYETIILYINDENVDHKKPVSICFCHKNPSGVYGPTLVGLDYDYVYDYGVYRQTLYQIVKRAHSLGFKSINWGFSADTEKKKVGAKLFPKVAYVQASDNFAQEMMEATTFIESE